ncbi:MAG: hypothetical protein PVSMB6_04160 [Steroidobacteraceae bacterium]
MSSQLTRLWQAAFNILFLAFFVLLAVSAYRNVVTTGSLRAVGILAVNILFAVLFLTRRQAQEESQSLGLWLVAMAATMLPLFLRAGGTADFVRLGTCVQALGLAGVAAGLLSLRRSFGVAPANRGVRDRGMYRLVRHPIYLAELTLILGVVIASPTVGNLLLWLCACGLQFARALAEEQFLSRDPAYVAYRAQVRYRLLPGVL